MGPMETNDFVKLVDNEGTSFLKDGKGCWLVGGQLGLKQSLISRKVLRDLLQKNFDKGCW